jgi:exoribonuclease R
MRRVTMAAKTASGTNINASEETKEVWKWSAIPRTMREKAATTAKREARRMLKMEYMVTSEDGSEWKVVFVESKGVV